MSDLGWATTNMTALTPPLNSIPDLAALTDKNS